MEIRVEDLFLEDDLRALQIPWVNRAIAACKSHEDVVSLWSRLCAWGPDEEDAEDILELSPGSPQMRLAAEKIRDLVRTIEAWQPPIQLPPRPYPTG